MTSDDGDTGEIPGDEPTLAPGEPRTFGNGRYTVRRRLGAGNFATVYLAYDERLDVLVAVKLLSDRWAWEPEVRGRFVQEARLLRSLNDARVVQIRDIAETDDGRPYLVMDFATHGTLEQRLTELAQRGVRPDRDQLRRVAAAIADALGFLHRRRIAHRDIKPSNILITTDHDSPPDSGDGLLRAGERLMLGDLGLAKDLSFDSGVTVGVGTAGYMAPEQISGGSKVDTRTDIYAASALFAQIASGEPPDPVRRYSGGGLQSGRPLSAMIPGPLAVALAHGLDVDPARRPPTIQDWHAEIDRALLAVDRPTVAAAPAPAPAGPAPLSNPPVAPVSNPPIAPVSNPPIAPVSNPRTAPVSNPPVVHQPAPLLPHPSSPGWHQPAAAPPPRGGPNRRVLVAGGAAGALVAGVVAAIVLSGGGDDPSTQPASRTTIPGSATTVVTTPVTTALTAPASTVITSPPTTAGPAPTTTEAPLVAPTPSISGPVQVLAGQTNDWLGNGGGGIEGNWTIEPRNVVITDDRWFPELPYWRATYNTPGFYRLTLTVSNAAGIIASAFFDFQVI